MERFFMERLKYIVEDSTIAELLGVQNFTNKESAILELVKNAYDAQANNVSITFSDRSIVIIDDGIGMSKSTICENWMHVGKSDKGYSLSGTEDNTRTLEINDPYTFKQGFSIAKWTNVRSDGQPSHDATWVDTDVPFFRTAEAYLTLAEATLRNGGSQKDALNAINVLRRRAHAKELSSITLDEILDEKANKVMETLSQMDFAEER